MSTGTKHITSFGKREKIEMVQKYMYTHIYIYIVIDIRTNEKKGQVFDMPITKHLAALFYLFYPIPLSIKKPINFG